MPVTFWRLIELLKITPNWVPFPTTVILVTGLGELVAAAALLTRPLRHWAGIALAVYSLCVWPANFKHALEGTQIAQIPVPLDAFRTLLVGVDYLPDMLIGQVVRQTRWDGRD